MLSIMRAVFAFFVVVSTVRAVPQSVSAVDGDIIFADQNRASRRITATHLDSDPSLSFDGSQVVFVRRTPNRTIDTGLGDVDENELWIARVDRIEQPRRVLAGHPGDFAPGPNIVLAGFATPQFSPDGRRIYFKATTWATAGAIHMLDVTTGKTRFLFPGLRVEVIRAGKYRGFLIGTKDPITEDRGRIVVYWLLDPDGKEVRRLGETEADLTRFKNSISER
jgi:Tol biopolymer transport system component